MSENALILLLIVIFVIVWILIKMGKFQGITGGQDSAKDSKLDGDITDYIQGEVTGGKDAEGFAYIDDKELDKLSVKGAAIVKKTKISGDLTSNGSLEIRGKSEVKGKTTIVGNLESSDCEFGDMNILGTANLYKSTADKVTVCGKLRAKGSTIKEVIIDPKCDMTDVQMPYIKLQGGSIGKITYPKGMSDEVKAQVVSQK